MNTTYNINHNIKVQLTDLGKAILKASDIITRQKLAMMDLIYLAQEPDEDGYVEMSLWEFMSIFGTHLSNGAPPVLEKNEIIFCSNEDEEE